ncbi:ferritin-like domain-containing protein [Ferruginibacter albus]|uniref:ferritin-like domain-containing protein n=1 Tax=Ferruginibacter albus TaxID=2875540 RepID=UPI001CC51F2E|nr:ferritin-like domain-containing protein [Ferruginibacter albus]UAY51273.1 ferritin-like domain-containing protein [Ferruginibacter albus]
MKAIKLFEEIHNEITDEGLSRRDALSKGLDFGIKAAISAIPLLFFELKTNKAKAAPTGITDVVTDVLNFALTLEYLEAEFYTTGLGTSNLIPGSDRTLIQQISKHETAHVALLQSTITSLNGTPVAKPTFDFTAGGTFGDVFTNYQTFLALSNAFEDTGVRAYKGQAANLLGSGAVLTAALDIHSVEARHASEIRRLRGLKGWISNAEANGLPAAIYAGEDNTMQGGVDVKTLTTSSATSITEAFDEPLTKDEVLAIAGPFIK